MLLDSWPGSAGQFCWRCRRTAGEDELMNDQATESANVRSAIRVLASSIEMP
jgi:hypothetical protein